MNIVAASSLIESVPPALSALVFSRRTCAGQRARLLAVGDMGFSGRVAATAAQYGHTSLFEDIAPLLQTGDIVFGNLEYPLAGDALSGRMFAGDPRAAHSLRQAGFTLIHLANNHVGEYGVAGLADTLGAVQAVGLTPLGVGDDETAARQSVRTDVNGLRIGWLGCGRTLLSQTEPGPHYWEFDEFELLTAVRQARTTVDVLMVSIHIGLMYLDYPRPEHKAMAERLMAAGTDLILMHHAHVLQGVQVTPDGKVCCYNLGNFLLDWREGNVEIPVMVKEQNEGAVFVFDLDAQGVALAAALPTYITKDCRVRWAVGERGQAILARLERISRDLEGDYTALFERQRAERNTSGILKVLAFHARRGNWEYVFGQLARLRPEHLRMLWRWGLARFPVRLK